MHINQAGAAACEGGRFHKVRPAGGLGSAATTPQQLVCRIRVGVIVVSGV